MWFLAVLGCEKAGDTGANSVGDNDSGTRHSSGDAAPLGFIGSPCTVDADCDYDGAVCLTEGFPNGLCSMPCDTRCPDRDGHPVTFCVDGGAAGGFPDDDGWCVSRCSFDAYEETGCRQDYGCTVQARNLEPWTETFSCLPYATPDLSECHYRLAERGVGFEPTVWPEDHPAGHPELTCSIADPVWVLSPVEGVALEYYDGTPTPRTLASCEAAHSIADTALDAAASGVEAILHMGTYNCRVIAGTSSLSRHGHGDAFDVFGFRFSDGTVWSLIEHWEHDTESPVSDAGAFLYDAAHRWYDQWIWNIILTPNYNTAHDNHFHLDLTPGWHDLSAHDGRFIGPAPYAD
ncbi:MAG: extensin family protein [Myxococcota bacterium]|nr:extensin family protein [Myxococcota bacterium]